MVTTKPAASILLDEAPRLALSIVRRLHSSQRTARFSIIELFMRSFIVLFLRGRLELTFADVDIGLLDKREERCEA